MITAQPATAAAGPCTDVEIVTGPAPGTLMRQFPPRPLVADWAREKLLDVV